VKGEDREGEEKEGSGEKGVEGKGCVMAVEGDGCPCMNDGLAGCECWSGARLQLDDWYAATAAVCVWFHCQPSHTPTTARRPSGLLMVHALLPLAVTVWLHGMTCI